MPHNDENEKPNQPALIEDNSSLGRRLAPPVPSPYICSGCVRRIFLQHPGYTAEQNLTTGHGSSA